MSTRKEPGRRCVAARTGAPLIPERGSLPAAGQHARKFASSQVTLMIRKEGTYVRAMTIAPARQLTLDIPWPGRDRGRVWDQMPDAARTRVLRLLAAMIAAGVLAGDDGGGQDGGAVRDDG
jgi:hypothetical protein